MNINPNSPVSISVVMCTYNGDKYLEQQIDSILCQTYPIHELIIQVQSPNQKIPNRKTKCVIETHLNIKQNVILGANLKPV